MTSSPDIAWNHLKPESNKRSTLKSQSPVIGDCRSWQEEMKLAIRTVAQLTERLNLPAGIAKQIDADPQFPLFVPEPLLRRIQQATTDDPILLQILPQQSENVPTIGFSNDPLAETSADRSDPVLKKYNGRALLVTTGVCGVHCRYCFRRHFPYQALPQDRKNWNSWLEPIANDPSIHEVILSGGDPLVLTDSSFQRLTEGLRQIAHVKWLRIHSRMPVVIPARVTHQLLESMQGFSHATIVLHINHANEIDASVRSAVQKIKSANVSVLNQSVLLRGINDQVETLKQLSIELVEAGIQPYYLHQLDRVQGAAHFEVDSNRAAALLKALRSQLPGHAVPQFVQEIPGQPYKTIINYI